MKTVFAFLFACFVCKPVFSQTEKGAVPITNHQLAPSGSPVTGTTRAVVTGISDYQSPDIPDLRFADRDAAAFAAWLQSPAGGSLPPEHIMLLTNNAATTGAIASAMDWLIAECKPGDRAIIYFSGHGDVETRTKFQRGFLLTYDSPPSNYLAGAFALIFLQDIISTLADLGVQVVMVSDACRAGKLAGSDVGGTQATAANLSTQFANEIKILSCQPDEFSLEGEQWGGGRGAFSYHLIEGLTGMADGNTDKQVNLLEINRYLEEVVPKETAPQVQIPMTVGNKGTVLAAVDEASLLAVRERKEKALPAISSIETKGFEDVLLAGMDSIWQKKYEQFTVALEKGELLEPVGLSACDLYQELSQVQSLEKLHGIMKRNLATALQDESQQAINAWLRADEEEMAARTRGDLKYTKFVRYLEKAAELLGEQHYMYRTLKAKQYYFDAVDIRVRFEQRISYVTDSMLIWKKRHEDRIQKALELEANAAFIQFEKGGFMEGDTICNKKAIELAPTWVLPYCKMAAMYTFAGNKEAAGYYIAKVLKLAPETSLAYMAPGYLHFTSMEYKQAEAFFLKAVQIAPRNVEWLKYLGVVYFIQQKYRDAENTFLQILELSPDDIVTYNQLAEIYLFKTYEYDKAEAISRKRLEMRPTDGGAYADLIYACYGRQPEKIRLLIAEMEAINASVKNWEGQAIIGYAYRALGEPEKAIPYYQQAIEAAPKSLALYYSFAGVYLDLGDYENFLSCLDSTFSIDWRYYSQVEERYKVEKACKSPGYKAFAQRVIDKLPQVEFGYRLMAEYFKGKGDFEEAVAYYEGAVAKSPDQQLNWLYYFKVAYLLRQTKKAAAVVQRYLALHPDDAVFMGDAAQFYQNHSAFEPAELLFKTAIEDPTDSAAVYRNSDLVELYYKSAIERSTHAATIYRNFSLLYFLAGNKSEAYSILDAAKKTDPDDLNTIALYAVLNYYDAPQDAKIWFDELAKNNPDYGSLWDGLEAMRTNAFEKADTCWQVIARQPYPFWKDMIKYRYLQLKIRQGEKEKAVELLSEILKVGWFVNYRLFANDPELDPIRDMEEFQKLMNAYFPEKTKN